MKINKTINKIVHAPFRTTEEWFVLHTRKCWNYTAKWLEVQEGGGGRRRGGVGRLRRTFVTDEICTVVDHVIFCGKLEGILQKSIWAGKVFLVACES